jgi:Rps23 Pro-64 3,4-dihydroxylase Tpa1-like proline 4-hydroxylase
MQGRKRRTLSACSDVTRLDAPVRAGRAPFPHWILEPFDRDFLASVKREMMTLATTFKETDLFRIKQTVDFANLAPDAFPHIAQLKAALYSSAFRGHVEAVTGCGALNDRVDCAGNVYSQGCHLGCHDDCISTRRVSYILYLSDDGWRREDGGELELFAPDDNVPHATIPPVFGTMMTFRVVGGASLHAVQEVFSAERRRVSIQGWFHTDELSERRHEATIAQLTAGLRPRGGAAVALATGDAVVLNQWVNSAYLASHEALRRSLAEGGCVLLKDFLLPHLLAEIAQIAAACDAMDSLGGWRRPEYTDGVAEGLWQLTGPPQLQRFCRGAETVSEAAGKSKLGRAALLLARVRHVLTSGACRDWIEALLGAKCDAVTSATVRRFRPGLDYTVARSGGGGGGKKTLFVTYCVVPPSAEWSGGAVGGHHIFTSGDEDAEKAREAAEVYENDADESDLISVCPAPNALSLVLVPPEQRSPMQFVQYLSAGAPG